MTLDIKGDMVGWRYHRIGFKAGREGFIGPCPYDEEWVQFCWEQGRDEGLKEFEGRAA